VRSSRPTAAPVAPQGSAIEWLFQGLECLTNAQMKEVAAAWYEVPRHRRDAAWTAVRSLWRRTASDESLDCAFHARRAATRVARLAGSQDTAFRDAACEAALALAVADQLGERHYEPLVHPMAQVLPWLLESPPVWLSGVALSFTTSRPRG
jgi:hypothetical protein